ncbi:MAG: tyrosine--tRNA ligase [Rhodoglobus sp.]
MDTVLRTRDKQMLERDMFERRIQANTLVHLHEFLYPLLQGYDSVAMDIDIELCGSDQEFNALMGRTLCRRLQDREKSVIEVNLLENPVTHELMSKSTGRGVFLSCTSEELYGWVMALPDEMTRLVFINNTRIPLEDIEAIMGGHPRAAKARLARVLVEMFHGSEAVAAAEADFDQRFVSRDVPTIAPVIVAVDRQLSAFDLAVLGASSAYDSRSAIRRVITQGGMYVDGTKIDDPEARIELTERRDVRVGKKAWFLVEPNTTQ